MPKSAFYFTISRWVRRCLYHWFFLGFFYCFFQQKLIKKLISKKKFFKNLNLFFEKFLVRNWLASPLKLKEYNAVRSLDNTGFLGSDPRSFYSRNVSRLLFKKIKNNLLYKAVIPEKNPANFSDKNNNLSRKNFSSFLKKNFTNFKTFLAAFHSCVFFKVDLIYKCLQ